MVKFVLPSLVWLACISACTNRDEGRVSEQEERTDIIYRNYQVTAEEGRDEVTVRLQFHAGGQDGDAIPLEAPGAVLLDNEPLTPDSTRFMGAYYEISKPVTAFAGNHTIVFIDTKKKQHRETFRFTPFTLAKELPDELPKKPFTIRLRNLPDEAVTLRLVITDTSMTSTGVNEEVTVENGNLEVTDEMLFNLNPGPVTLEIFSEEERSLGGKKSTQGRIAITYGLRRQLVLR